MTHSLTQNRIFVQTFNNQNVSIASRSVTSLSETLMAQVPEKQKNLLELKKNHGKKVIGEVTIDQAIGGARGVKCMLWETSNLDANFSKSS